MELLSFKGPRPVAPLPAPGLADFEAGLAKGAPQMARCTVCGRCHFPSPLRCDCGANGFEPVAMPESGTLYSDTIIHAAPGAMAREAPYRVGLVDLAAGGPRVLLRIWAPAGVEITLEMNIRLFVAVYSDGPVLAACPADCTLNEIDHKSRQP